MKRFMRSEIGEALRTSGARIRLLADLLQSFINVYFHMGAGIVDDWTDRLWGGPLLEIKRTLLALAEMSASGPRSGHERVGQDEYLRAALYIVRTFSTGVSSGRPKAASRISFPPL